MGQKKFNIKPNNVVCICPKCGNNTEFVAHSEQCGIDTCDVWNDEILDAHSIN